MRAVPPLLATLCLLAALACGGGDASPPAEDASAGAIDRYVLPEIDAQRTERLDRGGERFRVPEGFTVEQVAAPELTGSVVNLTFDHQGRPLLALEGDGLVVLEDGDGDGTFETMHSVSKTIDTAHGLYVVGPDELLAHANGPEQGTGLYRVRHWGDDEAEGHVELLQLSDGDIQEHGPHTITRGPDGYLYLLYGNHARPDRSRPQTSPLRALEEDHLLPVILDPRGHANSIVAPGGTIWRVDLASDRWELWAGGLRNPFDMAFSPAGSLFVYEADMEWDRGLPWFRPTRVLHAVPSGDYGWRTGSAKIEFDAVDTLPGVADIGRGSPVGVVFYADEVYPEVFRDAYFMGDWSRGRIRVLFPRRQGATWNGEVHDFVLGEPLNVTDLDVGPDGLLYFTTGGRSTSGGLYRVAWAGQSSRREADGVDAIVRQPMPRSAFGRARLLAAKSRLGEEWQTSLREAAIDGNRPAGERLRALEALAVHGPAPDLELLRSLAADPEPLLRAASVHLLGVRSEPEATTELLAALGDADPLVRRRACEALQRADALSALGVAEIVPLVVPLLGDDDRFVRYAARELLTFVEPDHWQGLVAEKAGPLGALEGILAVFHSRGPAMTDVAWRTLLALDPAELTALQRTPT